MVEPEIAVYLGKDVAAGADRETARAAISGVGPAIEILDVDHTSTADTVEDTLARDIFQRHVVLGSKDASRAGCNLQGLMGHIWKNGVRSRRARNPTQLQKIWLLSCATWPTRWQRRGKSWLPAT